MKKVLFIFFAFLAIAISSNAQMISGNIQISLAQKDDDRDIWNQTGDVCQENIPQARSIISLPVNAFLCDGIVNVYFESSFASVSITIKNVSTGEIVCSEQLINPTNFSLDLVGQDSGEYSLEIISDDLSLEGTFCL